MTEDEPALARRLVRSAMKGALATHDADSGAPYVSMVQVATVVDGSPVTLISGLARHTRNLRKSDVAALLIDATDATGDSTTGGRISLMGTFKPDGLGATRARFIARHPAAASYAGFGDFGFWRLYVASGHLIGGFGRIVSMTTAELHAPMIDAAGFAEAEVGLSETLRRRWPNVIGFDSEGVDILDQGRPRRIEFSPAVPWPDKAYAAAVQCLSTAT